MTKSVSLSTRLKIAASLKGNKNAYKGGPKKKLTAREKVANINARKNSANLSTEQRLRREKVAKRLRAEARKEESLGGGVSNSTPHAGVANKTPAMKSADKLATGNIPKLRDQTATKASSSLPKTPNKVRTEAEVREDYRKNVAPLLAAQNPKPTTKAQPAKPVAKPTTTERIKAANAKSKAAQEPRPRDERTVTGNGQKRTPDSQLSSEALAKAAIFEAKPDRNRPGVPFKKPVAKPTQNNSGVDNKQAAANATTKATSGASNLTASSRAQQAHEQVARQEASLKAKTLELNRVAKMQFSGDPKWTVYMSTNAFDAVVKADEHLTSLKARAKRLSK